VPWLQDINSDGVIEVVQAGYHNRSKYHQDWSWDSSHIFDLQEEGYIDREANTGDRRIFDASRHIVEDFNGDGCVDLFATAPYPDFSSVFYYTGNCDGTFDEFQFFEPGSGVFSIPGWAWNNAETTFSVTEIDGEWVAGLNVFWAESFDADGDGDPDVLYTLSGFKVPEAQREAKYITEDGEGYTIAYLLLNEGGSMKRYGNAMGDEGRGLGFFVWTRPRRERRRLRRLGSGRLAS
jgi:hypothetical protein